MREQIQELYNKFYGQDVFIIAGGYSVQAINIDYLYEKNTVAINDSYKILSNATALFWCDNSWCGREFDGLKQHQTKLRFHPRHYSSTHIEKDIKTAGGATVLNRTGDYGYDPDIDNVRGNNGGVQSLNFVINLGAKRIYLIGYDMRDDPLKRGKTHWHDNHQVVIRHDTYSRLFIPSMVSLNKEIRRLKLDVEIINCSKTSALTCFKKEIPKELIL
jgi:hypothetical protein